LVDRVALFNWDPAVFIGGFLQLWEHMDEHGRLVTLKITRLMGDYVKESSAEARKDALIRGAADLLRRGPAG